MQKKELHTVTKNIIKIPKNITGIMKEKMLFVEALRRILTENQGIQIRKRIE